MTDDFTILSDAELDQVSAGGDNPWLNPGRHHGPVTWVEQTLPSYNSITPIRAGWTFAWAANA